METAPARAKEAQLTTPPSTLASSLCLGAAAVCALLGWGCSDGCSARPRGVVLVIVDTLRADHLSCYGYGIGTTPNLDGIAAAGELYRNAWAHSPWTLPSVASILTGLPPQEHGAGTAQGGGFLPVSNDVSSLAARLAEAGYATGAIVNVEFLSPGSGLERGFEHYDYRPSASPDSAPRDARGTTAAALAWAATVRRQPFFLVAHYFDPHLPFNPPEPFANAYEIPGSDRAPPGFGRDVRVVEAMRNGTVTPSKARQQSLVARYDGEISFVDEQIGALRAGLSKLDMWDRSLFVMVADHGEELWDHGGFEHGHTHHRELLRVPLIVRRPGGRHAESSGRVRQIDIAPTVLDFAGVRSQAPAPGVLLTPDADEEADALGSLWAGELASIRADEGTLITNLGTGERELYAPEDRAESRNVVGERPEVAATLGERLRRRIGGEGDGAGTKSWPMSAELAEQLRALGYIATDAAAATSGDAGTPP